jgi:hypothetical protein
MRPTRLKCVVFFASSITVAFAQPRSATFFEPRQFPAGTDPALAVIEDFNHDGKPDIGVAGADGTISILLNNGDGFASPVGYSTGDKAKSIATADFNGDGNPDIAVVGGTGFVYVLLGNSNGTFQPAIAIALPSAASSVAAGDFTGDGIPDLVLAAGDILVLPGKGNGAFGTPLSTATGYNAMQVAAGDLNNDGKLDLVVRTVAAQPYEPPSQLVSLLGNGNGTFQPYQIVYPGYYAPLPYLCDVNDDGFADLVEPGIVVQLGNGDGTFQPGVGYPADGANAPFFADIDGDGQVDILSTGANSVSVLLGNGAGAFQPSYSYAANLGAVWIGAANFLGHGAYDIVALNAHGGGNPGFLSLLPGLAAAKYAAQPTIDFHEALGGQVLADFNGDGNLDAAVLGATSILILLGNGNGYFAPHAIEAGPYPIGLASGDFNGDGIPDLAVTGQNTSVVNILLGNGAGAFTKTGSYPVPASSYILAAADVNNDGALDLIVLGAGSVYGSSIAQVLLGNGHGAFGPPLTIVSSSNFLTNFVIGDFNGDGIPDVAFSEYQDGGPGVELYLGNGDGTFQSSLYPYPHGAVNLAAGDFNGDGKLDLALLGAVDGGEMLILLGNGDGTFQTGQATPNAPTAAYNFIAADLNGDGHLDLLVDNGGPVFYLYLGNGDGTFTEQGPELPCVGYSGNGCGAAVGDLTGDGKLDIMFSALTAVGGGEDIDPVSVLINTTGNH